MFGFNGQNIIESGINFSNPDYRNKAAELFPGTIRYPGGTIANYWNWREGDFMKSDFSNSSCFWTKENYATAKFSDLDLDHFKFLVNRTGTKPIFVLNTTTSDKHYQLAMLYHAASLNLPIKYIELDNELYSESCAVTNKFADGADYAMQMIDWTALIKGNSMQPGHFPNTEIAVVGAYARSGDPPRRLDWNADVTDVLGSNSDVDAMVIHPYIGSNLNKGGNSTNIWEANADVKCMFSTPNQLYINNPVNSIFPKVVDNEIGNHNLKTWMTEYNISNKKTSNNPLGVHGSWAAALFSAYLTLLPLENDNIDRINMHTMLGNIQYGAMYTNNKGLNNSKVISPPLNNSVAPCTSLNAVPQTQILDLTPAGQALQLITRAGKNSNTVTQIEFTDSNQNPYEFSCDWGNNDMFPGAYGWYFQDTQQAGSPNTNQAVIINFTENELDIDLNSTHYSGLNYIESISSEFYYYYYGEEENECYNPKNGENCECTYQKTQPISFQNSTVTLQPYSINRLFQSDVSNCNQQIKLTAATTDICDGSELGIQVNVLPETNNLVYNWSANPDIIINDGSSIVVAPGTTGTHTYTVDIPASAVCNSLRTASIDITVHPKPALNVYTNPTAPLICQTNQSVELVADFGANNNISCVWISDQAEGLAADLDQTESKLTVSPTETTTYTVYATTDNICYSKEDITVPILDLGESRNICRDENINLDLTDFLNDLGLPANYFNIIWSVTVDGTPLSVPNNTPILNIPANPNQSSETTISVTLTDNSNSSCTLFAETTIYSVNCCTNTGTPYTIEDGTTLSQFIKDYELFAFNQGRPAYTVPVNGSGFWQLNQTDLGLSQIKVNGRFIIDDKVQFGGIEFLMAEASQIIIEPHGALTLQRNSQQPAKLHACGNELWKGIYVLEDGALNLSSGINNTNVSTILSDAEYGIYIESSNYQENIGSNINLIQASLENNLTGVFVESSPIGFNGHVALNISGSTINGNTGAGLKIPYIGQNTTVGTNGYASLQLQDVVITTTNTNTIPNTIKNYSNGIVASRTSLNLENNKFENITADPTYTNKYNGTAIYAQGGNTFSSLEQIGFGKNSFNYSFKDCDKAIMTEKMNVEITETIFDNTEQGIIVKHGANRDINIQNNIINAAKEGIELWYNDFANSINVNYNDINFGYYAFPPVPPGNKPFSVSAINVYESINAHDYTANIHDNYIQFLGTNSNGRRAAIRLIGASEYNITDNEIYMANNLTDYSGIIAKGCDNSLISCNFIRGNDTYTSAMNNSSITSFVLGNPVTINCNDFDNTYEGLLIHGPTNNINNFTNVGGNNFRNHFNALHLTSSAIIGQQLRTGNLWFNNPVTVGGTQGKNAIYDNSNNAAAFEILVNTNTTVANANPLPSSNFIEPSTWVRPDPADPQNLIPNWECDAVQYCSQFNFASNNEGELDEEVMDESITNYPYTPETIWMLQSELYSRLNRDSILLNSDSLYQAFYNSMQADNIALFETVNEELQSAYELDPTVYNNLLQNNNNLNQLMDNLGAKMEELNDESLSTEALANIQAEIAALQNSTQALVAYNNNAIELAQTSQTLSVNNVEAVNTGIVSSETLEMNEQEINEIYLNTFAEDVFEFTTAQENSLFSIANQCPMAGGPAVFKARALYAQVDPQQSYDDAILCLQQGILLREKNDKIEAMINVYPNPTNNLINIEYTVDAERTVFISIYNSLGKLLIAEELSTNTNKHQLSLKMLNNGIYHYTIKVDGKNKANGKIVVIK